jgi:hypothetical protein
MSKPKSAKPTLNMDRPSARPRIRDPKEAAAALQDGETRLAVNIPIRIHRALKMRAVEQGRPMRDLVLDIFAEAGFS